MINPDKDPLMTPTDWKHQSLIDRMDSCRSMLFIHGALSAKESAMVRKRLEKWMSDYRKKTCLPKEPA